MTTPVTDRPARPTSRKVSNIKMGLLDVVSDSCCRAFGASWIGLSEPAQKRRELAIQNGANAVFDPTAKGVDVPAETIKATSGRGADVVFDCAGAQITMDTAFLAVRPRGYIMNVAFWGTRPQLDIASLTFKEVTFSSTSLELRGHIRGTWSGSNVRITGSAGCDRVHADMMNAIADGTFPVDGMDSLITRRIPLEDLVEKGIKALLYEKDEHGVWPAMHRLACCACTDKRSDNGSENSRIA